MIDLEFRVSRYVNKAYWMQAVSGWDPYVPKKYLEITKQNFGDFSEAEEKSLIEFKNFLTINRYEWLWNMYDRPIGNTYQNEFDNIVVFNVLDERFNKHYERHISWLNDWKVELEKMFTEDDKVVFKKLLSFFNLNQDLKIKVELVMSAGTIQGSTYPGKDAIILPVSSFYINDSKEKIYDTLYHELTHILLNKSFAQDLIKNNLNTINKTSQKLIKDLNEIIVLSIFDINHESVFNMFSLKKDGIKGNTYEYENLDLILKYKEKFLPEMKKYFDEEIAIDDNLITKLIKLYND